MFVFSYLVYAYVGICFIVFFFKQKTAYEMRISDWSSDVCSSDLIRCADHADEAGDLNDAAPTALGKAQPRSIACFGGAKTSVLQPAVDLVRYATIGRASCRARVGQYV